MIEMDGNDSYTKLCNTMELYVRAFKMKNLIVILHSIYLSKKKNHWGPKQKNNEVPKLRRLLMCFVPLIFSSPILSSRRL